MASVGKADSGFAGDMLLLLGGVILTTLRLPEALLGQWWRFPAVRQSPARRGCRPGAQQRLPSKATQLPYSRASALSVQVLGFEDTLPLTQRGRLVCDACSACRGLAPPSECALPGAQRNKAPRHAGPFNQYGAPNGIRTRVAALKGRCPRPLDHGSNTFAQL